MVTHITVTAKLGKGQFATIQVKTEEEVAKAKLDLRALYGNVRILVTRHIDNPKPE